jgi:Leu/Phe-tRNA-protein transferase
MILSQDLPVLESDMAAEIIISHVDEQNAGVFDVLESSYDDRNQMVVLVVYWYEDDNFYKKLVRKDSDYFRDVVVVPFRKCISNIATSNERDRAWYNQHLQEVYVNKFHLSPNDVWKY